LGKAGKGEMEAMKAAVMVDKDAIEFQEISTPSIQENEILVGICAIGVCGTDLQFIRGIRKVEFPHISGHEASGEVVRVGSAVKGFSEGDRVVIDPNLHCGQCSYCKHGRYNLCINKKVMGVSLPGCFAEYVRVPQENVLKVSPSLPIWKAALIEPVSVALHVKHKADIDLMDRVLVFGAGMIGLILVQLLKMSGVPVTIADTSEKKLRVAEKLGADKIVPISKNDLETSLKPYGVFDTVIDAAGVHETIEGSLRIAGRGGSIIWLGLPTTSINIDIFPFVYQELSIFSSLAYNPDEFSDALDLVGDNRVALEPIVTHTIAFEDIKEAFDLMEAGEAVKVLVTL
jgi:L-iditol 2-dehydrogenase